MNLLQQIAVTLGVLAVFTAIIYIAAKIAWSGLGKTNENNEQKPKDND